MKRIIYYPEKYQRYHLGNEDGNHVLDFFSADSLFSAIINCATSIMKEKELEIFTNNFINEKTISSLYPGIHIKDKTKGTSRNIYFLPKPYIHIVKQEETESDIEKRKLVKKLVYISEMLISDMFKHFESNSKCIKYDLTQHILLQNRYLIHKEEINEFVNFRYIADKIELFSIIDVPGVSIDRVNSKSLDTYMDEYLELKYYEDDRLRIQPIFHFYLHGEIDDSLKTVFALLCDQGIGGKRSSGIGMLGKVNIDDCSIELFDQEGKYAMILSPYFPRQQEFNEDDNKDLLISYQLQDRKGFIFSNGGKSIRKPIYRVLKEGSIVSSRIKGDIKNIFENISIDSISHPVYLYGKPLKIQFGR